MAYEPTDEGGESDLRRRAAWLLAMLVVVAILIVVVMTTLLNTDKGSGGTSGDGGTGLGPSAITSTGPPTAQPGSATPSRSITANGPGSSTGSAPSTGSSSTAAGPATCPTRTPCALSTDVGNAVAAINAFRAGQGKAAVPGSVSDAAKQCALKRGSGCSGGWAETEIPAPADGTIAVKKISQFAKLTDPQMTAIEVGWAFDPASKTYYFATIRKD